MKNRSKLWYLLPALYFFSGCATPESVSRLSLLSDQSYWLQGAEFARLPPREGLYLEVAFLRSTSRHLIFELGVQNKGSSAVLISPEAFRLQPLGVDRRPLDVAALAAVNPEEVLLDLDKRESRQIAEEINDNTRELLDATLNLAEDIAETGKPQTEEDEAIERAERAENQAYYDSERYRREMDMMSIEEQREYWSDNAIRRTTLEPGYETRGLVLFPRYNQASLLQAQFLIEDLLFSVDFQQALHHVGRP